MWTGVNAIQAKCAIHIAHFLWLKESEFTPSLDHYRFCRRGPSSANTILCPAACANLLISHSDFQRRDCRSDEVELADRANELAKRSVFEYPIHKENPYEIAEYQPGRPPGRAPKIE